MRTKTPITSTLAGVLAGAVLAGASVGTARADLAISSNDARTVLRDGVQVAGDGEPRDTVSILDVASDPPRLLHTLEAPGSVVGPPMAVTVARDESFAIVTGATKPQASPFRRDGGRLVLLDASPAGLRAIAEAPIGRWSQGIAFSRDGKAILVQNKVERTIQVSHWNDTQLSKAATVPSGAGPAAIQTAW